MILFFRGSRIGCSAHFEIACRDGFCRLRVALSFNDDGCTCDSLGYSLTGLDWRFCRRRNLLGILSEIGALYGVWQRNDAGDRLYPLPARISWVPSG